MVAHSPERVIPGRVMIGRRDRRTVGGIDVAFGGGGRPSCIAPSWRGEILLTGRGTAEMVKLMRTPSGTSNIALANEFALVARGGGHNVWVDIKLANRHPRVNTISPPGVGGIARRGPPGSSSSASQRTAGSSATAGS